MLASILFHGDPVLQAVADDRDRIASNKHHEDPAVGKLQRALLDWDSSCLPRHGADGTYGSETEAAVVRLKEEVLGVPAAEVIGDVGPKTVLKLDEMQVALDKQRNIAARTALIDGWIGAPLAGLSSTVEPVGVTVHPDGDSAFAALNAALERCVDDRALVVIAGWDFYETTPLVAGKTAGDALRAAAGRGARIRGLFAHFPVVKLPGGREIPTMDGNNTGATAFVNGLPNGAAIHDSLVLHHKMPGALAALGPVQVGMHHQKAWAVFDGTRLTAFCGGIDINGDRTTLSGQPPMHDVQVELDGVQAYFVYHVLRQRWNTHPEVPAGVTLPAIPAPPTSGGGQQRARVVTTFGNPARFEGLDRSSSDSATRYRYPFAPTGSTAYHDLLFQLIDRTERFIYVEDQYLVDEGMAIKLASALPRIKALIMVFAASNVINKELLQAWRRRQRFLDHFAPHAAKVAACVGNQFIHSKTWIFDDTIAVVGSANMNRRGYKHDSEMGIAFGDLVEPGPVKKLREGLWAKHLGPAAPPPNEPPEAALSTWKAPPGNSRVSTYNPTGGSDGPAVRIPLHEFFDADTFWDQVIDPDCP